MRSTLTSEKVTTCAAPLIGFWVAVSAISGPTSVVNSCRELDMDMMAIAIT